MHPSMEWYNSSIIQLSRSVCVSFEPHKTIGENEWERHKSTAKRIDGSSILCVPHRFGHIRRVDLFVNR